MKHNIAFLFAYICFSQRTTAQYNKQHFDHLKQLTGKWRMQTDKGTLHEEWVQVNDSLLKGKVFV